MKLCSISTIAILSLYFVVGCSNQEDNLIQDDSSNATLKSGKIKEFEFTAKFHSHGAEDSFAEMCFPPTSPTDFWGKDHQIGEGIATKLGAFIYDSYFCFHVVLDENGNPDFDNGFGEFKDEGLEGYFEMMNGDRIYMSDSNGQVLPSQTPGYDLEFHSVVTISGGTGKFSGATGEMRINGYVVLGEGTDHIWEGTIAIPKSK